MYTYERELPSVVSDQQLLMLLPDDALLDTSLTANLLRTTQVALEKARRLGRGAPSILLDRRRVRYRVSDLKQWLARLALPSSGRAAHGDV